MPVEVGVGDRIGDEMARDLEAHAARLGGEAVEAGIGAEYGTKAGRQNSDGHAVEVHDALLALPEGASQLGEEAL